MCICSHFLQYTKAYMDRRGKKVDNIYDIWISNKFHFVIKFPHST